MCFQHNLCGLLFLSLLLLTGGLTTGITHWFCLHTVTLFFCTVFELLSFISAKTESVLDCSSDDRWTLKSVIQHLFALNLRFSNFFMLNSMTMCISLCRIFHIGCYVHTFKMVDLFNNFLMSCFYGTVYLNLFIYMYKC